MITDSGTYERIMNGASLWAAYYRANPHRFVKDYLGVDLKIFQQIILYMMFTVDHLMYLASRGQGKTFLLAIFCCVKAILWPGSLIVIASKTRGQANEVLDKIIKILAPRSANLRSEIDWKHTKVGGQDSYITFKNGSNINVVCANENARHNRATVLIIDEYRVTPLSIIQEVLKKFLTVSRHPGYLDKPEYKDNPNLLEPNQELYASSCWYGSHWSYRLAQDYAANMLNPKRKYFICSLPYQLAIKESLLSRQQIEDEMTESTFDLVKFRMEMEALWWNENEAGFYHFDELDTTRKIIYPWLPSELSSKLTNDKHFTIPNKLKGEIRILSADLAVMADHKTRSGTVKNDATSIFVTQLQPGSTRKYARNVVYTDCFEGMHTSDQALMIRKLFADFNCDYIVIDARGVGFGIVDLLLRDQYDTKTGMTWPALASCTDMLNDRSQPGAQKVLWPIAASAQFNSDCALALRESFRNGSMRLLIPEYECDEELQKVQGFSKLDVDLQNQFKLPYLHTSLLINELVNLEYETKNGLVKIKEKSGMRKDRFSSLSYNNYVANQLEIKLAAKQSTSAFEAMFNFRKPQLM